MKAYQDYKKQYILLPHLEVLLKDRFQVLETSSCEILQVEQQATSSQPVNAIKDDGEVENKRKLVYK